LPAGLKRSKFLFLLPFLCAGIPACPDYPVIKSLTPRDGLFRQFQEDIALYNRAQSRGDPLPPLLLYAYSPSPTDFPAARDIISLAARLTLSPESLASLNGLDRSAVPIEGKFLLIPNIPGIFLRERPENTLEKILRSWRDPEKAQTLMINGEVFYFFAGDRFHPVERIFFLDALFTFPLDSRLITSRYGTRISPISGKIHFHNGLDIAAPRGSGVYAARAGTVIRKDFNSVLGKYLILAHSAGYETLYGHLDSVDVELNQTVNSGMLIGRVGSTGASTGPHLHFEVRERGEPRDPEGLLPRRIRQ
jgi:murein DD-endopeptidase MepM/ murein hydrolase activator NlpD